MIVIKSYSSRYSNGGGNYMNYYVAGIEFSSENSLTHHGIKGQKWGVRRFQNPDGTYTQAGKKRYKSFDDLKSRDKEDLFYEIGRKSGDIYYGKGRSNRFKKVTKEYDKEGEEINKLTKSVRAADRDLGIYESKRKSSFKRFLPKKYDKEWRKLNEEYSKKADELDNILGEYIKKYKMKE